MQKMMVFDFVDILNEIETTFFSIKHDSSKAWTVSPKPPRHAGLELDFDLPQIAVVGGQSVGKSSLLEALVGAPLNEAGAVKNHIFKRLKVMELAFKHENNLKYMCGSIIHSWFMTADAI